MLLIYLSCACLLGFFLGSVFSIPAYWAFIGLLPLPLLFVFPKHRRIIILNILCIIVAFLGVAYSNSHYNRLAESTLQSFNHIGLVEIKGIVDREPEIGSVNAEIILSVSEIKVKSEWQSVSGTLLIYTSIYPEYRYGDVLLVKGKLEGKPEINSELKSLSPDVTGYWAYLATRGIYSTVSYPRIDIMERDKGIIPLRWLYEIRKQLADTLARVLPEPHAALAQGITLGIRTNIPTSLQNDFNHSGTTHLLAISGVNLTIVAGILVSLTVRLFGRRHFIYLWVTLFIIWFYAWLTGLNPPIVRAAIMLSFFLAADLVGRQRNSIIALMMAATLMTILSPKTLTDVSFQMSFMAMTGLIFLYPPIQSSGRNIIDRIISEGKIRHIAYLINDSFSVSLGAVIATWPLTVYYFGLVSWVGPVATFVTLPVMPVIIGTGILAGGIGVFALPIGQAIAWSGWLPLTYLIIAVQVFADIPGTSLEIGTTTPALIIVYYTLLALLMVSSHYRRVLFRVMGGIIATISRIPKKLVIPPLLAVTVVAWLIFATMPDNRVHVSFLDVGQGDAILIEKGLQQILVDGGPDPQAAILELSKKIPFWDRTIDAVILTHPDVDHLTGLIGILERYKVRYVFSSNLSDNSTLYKEWLYTIDNHNIEHTYICAGHSINLGKDINLIVLSPPAENPGKDIPGSNEASVVLRLDTGMVSFLLTGDITTEVEINLISQRANLRSTILKVAHHGSRYSTGEVFLDVVDPEIAIISVGKNNKYGHPDQGVITRLTRKIGEIYIYRTDKDGTIEFITDGEKLWMSKDK